MSHFVYQDFPTEKIKMNMCYRNDALLEKIRSESPEQEIPLKVKAVYGDLCFPEASEHRPYMYSSIILALDGKMAFSDNPDGPVIARNNFLDPDGARSDFWLLNALRTYADGAILGALTLQAEPEAMCYVICRELAKQRVEVLKKKPHPLNVVVSLDGTDIPFDHNIFNKKYREEDFRALIATSPDGGDYIKNQQEVTVTLYGPYGSSEDVDVETLNREIAENTEIIPVIITGEGSTTDSTLLLWILRKLGIKRVLVESPSYTWHLMKQEKLDEFFVNYSMLFAGGKFTPGLNAPFSSLEHPHTDLLAIALHNANFMLTRQKMRYGEGSIQ